MDFFQNIEQIRDSFHRFAKLLPKDGTLIINGDIKGIDTIISDLECTIITYGSGPESDYYPKDITYDELARPSYTLCRSPKAAGMKTSSGITAEKITLGVTGEHNVLNSLAAIALADLLGIPQETAASALLAFHGTDRRFEIKGMLGEITILDDYAHHPTEIRATLRIPASYLYSYKSFSYRFCFGAFSCRSCSPDRHLCRKGKKYHRNKLHGFIKGNRKTWNRLPLFPIL